MMHIDRNGQYSSYWCIILSFFRYLSILTLKWDIDTDTDTAITHTHTHSLNCTSPSPSSSFSFFLSFFPSLPPSSFFRSFVRCYLFESITHTHTLPIIHRTINWSISVHSFFRSFDRSLSEHPFIDWSITNTLYYYYWLPAVHCVCVYACVCVYDAS